MWREQPKVKNERPVAKVLNIGKSEFFSLAEAVGDAGVWVFTTTDAIKWLKEDRHRISLFFRIAEARLVKGPVDQRMKQLIARGLVKSDRHGIRLSEQGWKVFETVEALTLLDKIP